MRILTIVIMLAWVCLPSHASVISIDQDNSGGALCSATAPCGTITITGTTTLHVVIDMNSPFGIFGNNDTFGFNVTGPTTGVTINNFSVSGFTGTGGNGNEDGWGSFEFRVDGPGGSGAVSSLSFDITRSGTPFSGPSDIEAGSTGGNGVTLFGLHVRNDSTGFTGYAGTDSGTSVPEPATFGLMGGVLCMAGLLRKRLVKR